MCIVAVGTSAYAVWSVNRPHANLEPGSDGTAVSTAEPAPTTTSPDPALSSSSPEQQSVEPHAELDAQGWLDAWAADGADLLVIGDGYSHLPEQWVQVWGTIVGAERAVSIRHWGEAEDQRFNPPIELSTGTDGLMIWSASRDRSTIQDAVDRLDRFDSASVDPEAVLISLGQGSGGADIPAAMDDLLAGLPEAPVLLVVGPTDLYDPGVGEALAVWGAAHGDEVVTVDLRQSIGGSPTAEEWAQAFEDALEQ